MIEAGVVAFLFTMLCALFMGIGYWLGQEE